MITDLNKIRQVLARNKSELAFIVGNGINRYAYGGSRDVSWNGLLLDVWQQISTRTLSDISEGISLTEFYDMMEFEAGSIDEVRAKVVDLLEKWAPEDYHRWLRDKMIEWDVPLLTTNFDRNLEDGLRFNKLNTGSTGFTDYYPWNVYYGNRELSSPIAGFGVWHINGMAGYRRSIRLSLSEYTGLASRVQSYLYEKDRLDDFDVKTKNRWNGIDTWLHIIFSRSLCVFGLALEENETFLRWLLIERAKYFRRFPDRRKKGWFICTKDSVTEGKRFFLDYLGFELVTLDHYDAIYKDLFDA